MRINFRMRMLPPKGCVAVRVGSEGERRRRFVVPVGHLSHPLFVAMLDEAEREFGFEQKGPIVIPCRVEYFRHAEEIISRDADAADAADDDVNNNERQQRHHVHHFAGCFRA